MKKHFALGNTRKREGTVLSNESGRRCEVKVAVSRRRRGARMRAYKFFEEEANGEDLWMDPLR